MSLANLTAKQLLDGLDKNDRSYPLVRAEIEKRLEQFDQAREQFSAQMIESFARSASYAVTSLWLAHKGVDMTDAECRKFGEMLFGFFAGVGERHVTDKEQGIKRPKTTLVMRNVWESLLENYAKSARSQHPPTS